MLVKAAKNGYFEEKSLSKRKAKFRGLDLPCKATRSYRFTCFALREVIAGSTSSFVLKATSCQAVKVQSQGISVRSGWRSSILSDSVACLGWCGVVHIGFGRYLGKWSTPELRGVDTWYSEQHRRSV